MEFTTERLVLRPWQEEDAEVLYELAKDPKVGPITGWPPHTSLDESRAVLKNVLMVEETYAIVLKETGQVIGDISLFIDSHTAIGNSEMELGYWLGSAYWGRGYMPEAAACLARHGFEDLKLSGIWSGYYSGNYNSRRVMEKIGMTYTHTETGKDVPLLHEVRDEDWFHMTYEQWLKHDSDLSLVLLEEQDIEELTGIMKRAFDADSRAFAGHDDGPKGYDDGSFLRTYGLAENSDAYVIVQNGRKIGAVIVFAKETEGYLGSLFLDPDCHSRGIGQKIWRCMEYRYPKIHVWETDTPLISRRNLNFYVNKLGFVIYAIENVRDGENAFVHLRKTI